MITVKSNIDGFLKAYKKKVDRFQWVLQNFAEKLAERMKEDMSADIESNRSQWQPALFGRDETGKLGFHDIVDINITSIGTNAVQVSIGDNMRKHDMADGTIVNPAYFIEFGFGLAGQGKPMQNADKYGWIYNRNGHTEEWAYEGWDGKWHISDGTEGLNFMYNTIQKYKTDWKNYLIQLLNEGA